MKKYIVLLLSLLLFIPTVVKADTIPVTIYNNENIVVGGDLEISLTIKDSTSKKIGEIQFLYDESMLSISKSNIQIFDCGTDIFINKDASKDGLTITIANGKVGIKADKDIGVKGCIGEGDDAYLRLKLNFKTLKSGTAKVEIQSQAAYTYGGGGLLTTLTANVKEPEVKPSDSTDCITAVEEPEEPQEPVDEPEEAKPVTNEENKEEVKQDNTLLYISLGANAVLFLGLILALVLKKKPEPVPQPAPTPEPVPQNTDTNNEQ